MLPSFRRLLIAVLLVALSFDAQAIGIHEKRLLFFGHDDRNHITPNQTPWNAVGQIETESGTICTATLIAPQLLMSAAHCFAGQRHHFDRATVFSLALNGAHAIRLPAARVIVDPKFLKGIIPDGDGWIIPSQLASKDIALISLKRPAPPSYPPVELFLGSKQQLQRLLNSHKGLVTQGGYPIDHPSSLWVHRDCHVISLRSTHLIEHQCDTLSGDSGSPLFVYDKNNVRLIGVQSSAPDVSQRRSANNMAVAITNLPNIIRTHIKVIHLHH